MENKASDFTRVRQTPSWVWKQMDSRPMVGRAVWLSARCGIAIAMVTIVPIMVIGGLALTALGLVGLAATWSYRHTERWQRWKENLLGRITDFAILPHIVWRIPEALESNRTGKHGYTETRLVVFIHGFLHNRSFGTMLGNEIVSATKDSDDPITDKDIYSINLAKGVTIASIDEFARYLATKVEEIRLQRQLGRGELKVILVGHSMGGLVAGCFATRYTDAIGVKVQRIIANGTPWKGTGRASYLPLIRCVSDMTPEASFHKEVTRSLSEQDIDTHAIGSSGDGVVPVESALAEGLPGFQQYPLPDKPGHLGMLRSPQLQQLNIGLVTEAWTAAKSD